MTLAARPYVPVIDWLKSIGMMLILLGHLAGGYTNDLSPPIYPKQLGVAFFVFAMGYSLAGETRSRREVLFNRLFEMILWGVGIAIVVSLVTFASSGRLALSNYMPFAFGANVVVNHFPANPTTWYIGTYIHLLCIWCIVRPLKVTRSVFLLVLVLEVVSRALLIRNAGLFVAYMLFPNWLGVLCAGIWAGQQRWSPRLPPVRFVAVAAGGIVLAASWYGAVWPLIGARTFPFMTPQPGGEVVRAFATSCAVTFLYLGWTLLCSWLFWQVATPGWVRFIARNTLFIFIAHMPVFYAVDPLFVAQGMSYAYRSVIELLLCLVGLAAVSELLHHAVPIRRWRDSLRNRLITPEVLRRHSVTA